MAGGGACGGRVLGMGFWRKGSKVTAWKKFEAGRKTKGGRREEEDEGREEGEEEREGGRGRIVGGRGREGE